MKKTREAALETRNRILLTAMNMIRAKGFEATRVDDICAAAGVTKGAFFHHFKSKEDLATKAADFFSEFAENLFSQAPFQKIEDPLERFFGYLDLREAILQGEVASYTCLLGTMVQEAYNSHPAIREACREHIFGHADTLVPILEEAIKSRRIEGIDALDLAYFTQTVLQGSFVLCKAEGGNEPALAGIRHLRRYCEYIFKINQAA